MSDEVRNFESTESSRSTTNVRTTTVRRRNTRGEFTGPEAIDCRRKDRENDDVLRTAETDET